MKWFKFYGQDFLTDSKLGGLNPFQRLMWVALLCVASQDDKKTGVIRFLEERRLVALAGLNYDDMESMYGTREGVTLVTFCDMGLVTRLDENTIVVTNYNRKQTEQSTSAERMSLHRAKKKEMAKVSHVTNVMSLSDGRIEESRGDINTILPARQSSRGLLVKKKP
jgi:hypothetical protein